MNYIHLLLITILTISSYANNIKPSIKSTKDCPRIRRAWHLLSTDDQQLVLDGMLALRNANNYNLDELVQIAKVHTVYYTSNIIHQSSANLFWHGYLVWELESRIRALPDEKYKCFAMPYYDFTIDYQKESSTSIMNSIFGGTGDPNNNYRVNDYSWKDVSIKDWFVPDFCFSGDEEWPICSLKRKVVTSEYDGKIIPSAKEMAEYFTSSKYSNFKYFSKYYEYKKMALQFLTGAKDTNDNNFLDIATVSGAVQGYEPIWWLFHSFIQYHLSLWINCHGYDGQNMVGGIEKLRDNTNAYTAYCGGYMTSITDTENCANGDSSYLMSVLGANFVEKYMLDFSFDAHLYVPLLQDYEWAYVHKNSLSVRDLYYISEWNVKYDVGSFYYAAGLDDSGTFCRAGQLNTEWFIDSDGGREYYVGNIEGGGENKEFNLLNVRGVIEFGEREEKKVYGGGYMNYMLMVVVFGIFVVFLLGVVYKFYRDSYGEDKYYTYIALE